MPTLLVVDDDAGILSLFRALFGSDPRVTLQTATCGAEAVEQFGRRPPDAVLLDLDLPDQSGLETFDQLRRIDARVPVIFLTGQGTTDSAIEAMALGAHDYLLKPFPLPTLREKVHRAFEVRRQAQEVEAASADQSVRDDPDAIVGRSEAMQEIYKSIGRVAPQMVTVLIQGESGTGKELVARAICRYSRRSTGPFVAVNCAAIPENLLESELFGHEKGAFTGADRRRIGKFEQCDGGTLFLDEIGDMTPLTQAKVLRVLHDQQFGRLGGNEMIRTDVRLIAATNQDLGAMVAAGRFRRDLYYRLNGYTILLPPLRDRVGDLPLLIEHFLRRFERELGKEVQRVAPESMELLRRHSWPGNLRELQSVLKQAMLRSTGPILGLESFTAALGEARPTSPSFGPLSSSDLDRFLDDRLQAGSTTLQAEWESLTERHLLTRVLEHVGGNLSQAARVLGIHRATLRARLASLNLKAERGR